MTIFPQIAGQTARLRASETLRVPGIRLRLILLLILLCTFWVGSVFVCESLFYGVPWSKIRELSDVLYHIVSAGLYVLDGAVILFLCLPLTWGALSGIMDTAFDRPFRYTSLFIAFSGGRVYRRALALMLSFFLRYAILFGVFAGGICAARRIPTRSPLTWTAAVLLIIFSALFLVLGSLYLCRDDAVFYLAWQHPEWSVRTLYRHSRRIFHNHTAGEWLLHLSLIVGVLLSVPTLFLLLLFHLLPYYALAFTYRSADVWEESGSRSSLTSK